MHSTSLQHIDPKGINTLFKHIVEDIDEMLIFVYEFKLDGKCIYANNACGKHFGKPKDELMNQKMRDFSKTFADGQLPEDVIESLLAGNAYTFEDEHVNADGESIPVETTLRCFTENDNQYAVAYCVDIRERKVLAQQALAIQEKQARIEAESHFKRLVETYPDPLIRVDLKGAITYVRDDVALHVGYSPDAMLGKKLSDLVVRAELKPLGEKFTHAALKAARENVSVVYEDWVVLDGEQTCTEARLTPERDNNGKAIGVLGFFRDITERAIQNEIMHFLVQPGLRTKETFFEQLVVTLKSLFYVDCAALFFKGEKLTEVKVGASSGSWFTKDQTVFLMPHSMFELSLNSDEILYAKKHDKGFPTDAFLSEHNVTNLMCMPLRDSNKQVVGFLSLLSRSALKYVSVIKNMMSLVANNVVVELERIKFEEAEANRAEEFRVLVENSPDYISRFDMNFNCLYVNRKLAELGFKPGDAQEYAQVEFKEQVDEVLASGVPSSKIYRGLTPNNKVYDVETRVRCEWDSDGNKKGAIVISRDISDRVILENRLRKQAETDALTDLPNRRILSQQLHFALASAKRTGHYVALLFIDLDRFKAINDTLGHEMGDEVLREAARRLTELVSEADMVSRFGGDEFVVLLTAVTSQSDIVKIAEAIIYSLSKPYYLDAMTTYLSASIGIANYPDDTDSASEIIAHADQAMYLAKQQGRNTYRFFTNDMQAKADERLLMLNDLRVALDKNQFRIVFQPIIDARTGQIFKAEALLRWIHPQKGNIPPDKFIPLAEDTGLIDAIGDWVFTHSIRLAKQWQRQSAEDIQVSINISPRQFNQDNLVTRWLNELNDIGLPTKHIMLEVTESLLLEEQDNVQTKISAFRNAGVKFALDDFGTGYSAMSYLKKFPLDYLKIDGSFVRDMTTDQSDLAIVETIAVMATRLGLKSIAECTETAEQERLLRSFGCDYIQGYLYSKPLNEDDFLTFVLASRQQVAE